MPKFGPDVVLNDPAFIHPTAHVYGKVTIEHGASLWVNVVIRAENFDVHVGPSSNIQDFVMIHVGGGSGTRVGAHCSITHHCTLHGCTIGDNCLIGINATIMDGCVIGDNCIVAGGAFLKERTIIPDNSIVMGIPGKVVRTQNNWIANRFNAHLYEVNARACAEGHHRAWSDAAVIAASQTKMDELRAEFETLFGAQAPD